MLSFLEPTENAKSKIRTTELTIAGNYSRKRQEIAIRNFSIRNNQRVELSHPENRRIEYRLEKGRLFELCQSVIFGSLTLREEKNT